jgi:hypothetical protein
MMTFSIKMALSTMILSKMILKETKIMIRRTIILSIVTHGITVLSGTLQHLAEHNSAY